MVSSTINDTVVSSHASFQRQATLGHQDVIFPGVYIPRATADLSAQLDLINSVPDDDIKRLLQHHGGAVLFRDFEVKNAQGFSDFVFSLRLGPQPHKEVGRPPRRTVLAKAVSTANEGPPDSPIWVHNEYGWSKIYPGYIVFFALTAPKVGGQTPINSGIELARRMKVETPNFYRGLEQKGLLYIYRYTWLDNPRSNVGTSVLAAYGEEVAPGDSDETIKSKLEREIRKHSDEFEWHDDKSVSVWHRVPAIREHHATGLTVFFGNVISAYERAKHHDALLPPYLGRDGAYHPVPKYGDGSAIEIEGLDRAAAIVKETHVLVEWQDGDVLVLDNHAVQHAREPWLGERRILASLWDGLPFPDSWTPTKSVEGAA